MDEFTAMDTPDSSEFEQEMEEPEEENNSNVANVIPPAVAVIPFKIRGRRPSESFQMKLDSIDESIE